MPIVPSRVPRVETQPLRGGWLSPNAPAEAFGGGIASNVGIDLSGAAAGINAIGQQRERIRLEEKAKADQIANTHAYGALTTRVNAMMHGENGILNRQGKDAFTADQDAYDQFGSISAEIRESLGNDDQRAIFDKAVMNEWLQVDSQVQPHIARQRKLYDAQGTDALVTAKRVEAIRSYDKPEVVEQSITIQKAAIADHLKRTGAPAEVIANEIAEAASATRFGVLQTMLNNEQDLAAEAYFTAHKAEFVEKDLQQAERLTQQGSARAASRKAADEIVKTSPDLLSALNAASAIESPKVREETEQRLRRHFADQSAAQRQQREQAFQSLSDRLERNGGDIDRLKTSTDWFDLSPSEHNALELRARRIRNPDDYGAGDQEQFMTLMNQAYFNPDEFAQEDLLKVQGLNTSQKTRLMTLQRQVGLRGQRDLLRMIDKADRESEPTDTGDFATDSTLAKAMAGTGAPAPSPRATSAPLGLTPIQTVELTPKMLDDIVKKGPRYADYLRTMHVNVPDNIDALVAAEKEKAAPTSKAPEKKKPKGLHITRDSAGGTIVRPLED